MKGQAKFELYSMSL